MLGWRAIQPAEKSSELHARAAARGPTEQTSLAPLPTLQQLQNKTASRRDGRRLHLGLALGCGGEIAEPLEVLALLLVTRRQLEQPRGGAAENVVLGLLREERQVVDRRGQIEIPVRIIRRVKELRLGVDHTEGALQRLAVLYLHRLRGIVHVAHVVRRLLL